jgi:transcriptional regulator with XRE-family HTH domain
MQEELQSIGKEIKRIRMDSGLSQKEVAEKAGMKQQNLAAIEAGQRNASYLTLQKIASALDCEIEVILTPKTIKQ